jgi:murein DD-endopeptidase MepM/ murein hydrolase activator NlpD
MTDDKSPLPGKPETVELNAKPGSRNGARVGGDETPAGTAPREQLKGIARVWEGLVRMGLGESALRIVTSVVSISLFLIVVWVMGSFYLRAQTSKPTEEAVSAAAPQPTAITELAVPVFVTPAADILYLDGLPRLAMLHTTLPEKPRSGVTTYVIQKGDTLFGIAEKFNLKPETILWGNRYTLGSDPHMIRPGTELNILPVNGAYHRWSAGEGLNGVAKFYGVTPEDIINWAGNNLTVEKVGDFSHPNIEPGTFLVIPGGHAEFPDFSTPRISRADPAVAKGLGAGSCPGKYDGAIGTGSFVWPTTMRNLSGYDFNPAINHYGIDIAGSVGNPIYAVDSGVVVFAGWNTYGYGNLIAIDHGNGWQSIYAHLSALFVGCGQSVAQGATIGGLGSTGNSTGPHLHFELRSDHYGRVNPWDFLK